MKRVLFKVITTVLCFFIYACDVEPPEEKLCEVYFYTESYMKCYSGSGSSQGRMFILEVFKNGKHFETLEGSDSGTIASHFLPEGDDYQVYAKVYNHHMSTTEPIWEAETELFDVDADYILELDNSNKRFKVDYIATINDDFTTELTNEKIINLSDFTSTTVEDDIYNTGYEFWFYFIADSEQTQVVFDQDGYSAVISVIDSTDLYNSYTSYTSFVVDTIPGRLYYLAIENITPLGYIDSDSIISVPSSHFSVDFFPYEAIDLGNNSLDNAKEIIPDVEEFTYFEKRDDVDCYSVDTSINNGYFISSDYPVDIRIYDASMELLDSTFIFKSLNYYINSEENEVLYIEVEPITKDIISPYNLIIDDIRDDSIDILLRPITQFGGGDNLVLFNNSDELILRVLNKEETDVFSVIQEYNYSGVFLNETYNNENYATVTIDPVTDRENVFIEAGLRDSNGSFYKATCKLSLMPEKYGNNFSLSFYEDGTYWDSSWIVNSELEVGIENMLFHNPLYVVTNLKDFLREEVEILNYVLIDNKPIDSNVLPTDVYYQDYKYYLIPDVTGEYQITFYYGTENDLISNTINFTAY